MFPLPTAWKILCTLGPGWVLTRLRVEAELRLGTVERRVPVSNWDVSCDNKHKHAGEQLKDRLAQSKFFFSPQQPPKPFCAAQVCREADRVLAGEWTYFFHSRFQIRFPPDWHFNALDRTHADNREHWRKVASRIEASNSGNCSDIKCIWEPSRFSVAYLLVRAYATGADDRYAEAFWTLVEDWAEHNPPNRGPNWASGQEAALRVMAWCFGLYGFLNASCSTPERVFRLVKMIEVHGERIAGFIEYALSQRNNHGISEAVGLFTIGVLFPHLRRAPDWTRMGQRLIVRQLREQVYEDGTYIQHSFNYERVLIDLLVWLLRLGEIYETRFASECYGALDRAVKFMVRFCDLRTGHMPNYGANDGSLVLPLSNCDYTDFRPSLDAAHYLLFGKPLLETEGPWSESSAWLVGRSLSGRVPEDCLTPSRRDTRTSQPASSFGSAPKLPASGYLKLFGTESEAMLRAARYKDRPSHADQLHLDLWWRGQNVACDAGSYLYNGEHPWRNALAGTSVHNTVTIGGRDQMTRAGRFLWLDWAQANPQCYALSSGEQVVEAEHDGYARLGATHRRSVLCLTDEDIWIVVDDVTGSYSGEVRLHWLFADVPFKFDQNSAELQLHFPEDDFTCMINADGSLATSLARAGEIVAGTSHHGPPDTTIRGWRSLYYGSKEPALSLAVELTAPLPVRFVTLLMPSGISANELSSKCIKLQVHGKQYRIQLQRIGTNRVFSLLNGNEPLIRGFRFSGGAGRNRTDA